MFSDTALGEIAGPITISSITWQLNGLIALADRTKKFYTQTDEALCGESHRRKADEKFYGLFGGQGVRWFRCATTAVCVLYPNDVPSPRAVNAAVLAALRHLSISLIGLHAFSPPNAMPANCPLHLSHSLQSRSHIANANSAIDPETSVGLDDTSEAQMASTRGQTNYRQPLLQRYWTICGAIDDCGSTWPLFDTISFLSRAFCIYSQLVLFLSQDCFGLTLWTLFTTSGPLLLFMCMCALWHLLKINTIDLMPFKYFLCPVVQWKTISD